MLSSSGGRGVTVIPKTELIFTDEEIDRVSNKIVQKLVSNNIHKAYAELYYALETLKNNCKIADMIISDTIKNENGEETNTEKFKDIKSFAQYIKCFNDLNIQFIEKMLGENE